MERRGGKGRGGEGRGGEGRGGEGERVVEGGRRKDLMVHISRQGVDDDLLGIGRKLHKAFC